MHPPASSQPRVLDTTRQHPSRTARAPPALLHPLSLSYNSLNRSSVQMQVEAVDACSTPPSPCSSIDTLSSLTPLSPVIFAAQRKHIALQSRDSIPEQHIRDVLLASGAKSHAMQPSSTTASDQGSTARRPLADGNVRPAVTNSPQTSSFLPQCPASSSRSVLASATLLPLNSSQRRLDKLKKLAQRTAVLTAEICVAFGPLLVFLQSPQCRLFSRCSTPVAIYRRDLTTLCGYGSALALVRILSDLNSAGKKFDTFRAVTLAVRSEQQKHAILQLIGNGGDSSAVFQDVTLYHAQFDQKPWSSVLIRPVKDEVVAALLAPTDQDLVAMDEAVGGDLVLLARILSGFLDGSIGGGVVRNRFLAVEELIRAVSLVVNDEDLGDLGIHSRFVQSVAAKRQLLCTSAADSLSRDQTTGDQRNEAKRLLLAPRLVPR